MVSEKIALSENVNVTLKASAACPRLYRNEYGRDIFLDMEKLLEEFFILNSDETDETEVKTYTPEARETAENMVYLFSDKSIEENGEVSVYGNISTFLAFFDEVDLYILITNMIVLWLRNTGTLGDYQNEDESKKK